MRIKQTIKCIVYTVVGVLLLTGCAKENSDTSGRSDGKMRISFFAPIIADEDSSPTPEAARKTTLQPVTRAALSENTTVRVVAYIAGETTYKAEQTYYISGGKLKPCTVNADGSFDAIDTKNELALIPDKYDFYAITPALPLSSDHKSITVTNGVDHASSVTTNINVTADQTLTLTQLDRKCVKIALVIKRADDNSEMTALSVASGGVTINNLPAQTTVKLNESISQASGSTTLNIPKESFSPTDMTATTYLLPRLGTDRLKIDYNLTYTVSGVSETKVISGTMGNTVLEKGKSYTFTLTMRKTGATVSVKDWIDGGNQNVGLSTIDYTDNNKGWFQMVANDAHNPSNLTSTVMNWYVATGTADTTQNPNGQYKVCPTGWRMPTPQEMMLTWIYKEAMPESSFANYYYLTSLSYTPERCWYIHLNSGASSSVSKITPGYVRCVKDVVPSEPKYPYVMKNNNDEGRIIISRDAFGGVQSKGIRTNWVGATPLHNELEKTNNYISAKLEIAKSNCTAANAPDVPQTSNLYTWSNAAKACAVYHETETDAGSWRLPTQREIELIYIMKDSFTNIDTFSGVYFYWSATETSSIKTYAWRTTASNGDTFSTDKNTTNSVRCVRDMN